MESSTSRPATSIPIPSRVVLRGIIQFLFAQDFKSVDIHKQLVSVYGESVMSESMVRRWVREFKAGRHSLEDESGRGRPSLITDELTTKIENAIRNDRRLTLDELHNLFPEISRSLIHEIVSEKLEFRKVCARWVPRELTPLHKATRVTAVTGDETWVAHYTPENKRQSMQWKHTYSPTAKKFKVVKSVKKIMVSLFWDQKGILLIDFLPQGATINAERYCETLKKLRRAIQNKRRGMLTAGVSLLHDNARPHVAASTTALLNQFSWDVLTHPPYSPDLAPSDYHLFTKLKESLAGKRFQSDEEVQTAVTNWTKELAGSFYAEGISKLVSRYTKLRSPLG
ncbi:PREDICTED: histone-lysine N-methyltransferase SETMAR-like [Acromyrmex echinatior]|uniref:histone-lysine N-methyltransferase SETMAR-like n=1 Tax=Acromyrmex echinatior TaxID=103372 RepID=UPI000580BFA6|nr:PREDICTED: histone-lysine N-methyltransferase SETMAR-like [Acromyrmex echinatior]